MKYEELETEMWLDYGGEPMPCYPAKEADEAIAELKDEIKRKEAVEQRWFERCMEARSENVKLKRALWLARARVAHLEAACFISDMCDENATADESAHAESMMRKWQKIKQLCLKKAKEYE